MGTHNCDINAECNDTKGSYECTCNKGYNGTGVVCSKWFACTNRPLRMRLVCMHTVKPGPF